MKPARKIKASNKLSTRGKHNSSKMLRMIPWESTLERDFIKVLDYDPSIISFDFQPIKIEYYYQGKKRKYYPDFKVKKIDMKEYIYEVKAHSKLNHPTNLIKYQVGAKYCSYNNMKFHVVTEKDIRQGFLIENLDLINEVRADSVGRKEMNDILMVLTTNVKPMKVAELRELCVRINEPAFWCNFLYLLGKQRVQADLISSPINEELVVRRR
jgi:TnsA endonuclease N terminal